MRLSMIIFYKASAWAHLMIFSVVFFHLRKSPKSGSIWIWVDLWPNQPDVALFSSPYGIIASLNNDILNNIVVLEFLKKHYSIKMQTYMSNYYMNYILFIIALVIS